MMRPAVVRLVGNSSLGSMPARSLLRAVRKYALRSNFIVTTEVGRNERSDILRRLAGWGTAHVEDWRDGEDECSISHRRFGWRRVNYRADLLSRTGIARRGGLRAYSLDALYENRRTKQRVMICAFHLPNTEDGQRPIWDECVRRLATKADRWEADPEIDCVILAGPDWNWNWRIYKNRQHLRRVLPPGAEFTWGGGRMPSEGTHRRNLIGFAAVWGGIITRAELLADDASSDHRPWWMRVVVGSS